MIKKIIGIAALIILTSVLPDNKALANSKISEKLEVRENALSKNSDKKKRKLKKTVRKAGRIYRKIQDDRDSKKKSRKVQRKVRSIINIF